MGDACDDDDDDNDTDDDEDVDDDNDGLIEIHGLTMLHNIRHNLKELAMMTKQMTGTAKLRKYDGRIINRTNKL